MLPSPNRAHAGAPPAATAARWPLPCFPHLPSSIAASSPPPAPSPPSPPPAPSAGARGKNKYHSTALPQRSCHRAYAESMQGRHRHRKMRPASRAGARFGGSHRRLRPPLQSRAPRLPCASCPPQTFSSPGCGTLRRVKGRRRKRHIITRTRRWRLSGKPPGGSAAPMMKQPDKSVFVFLSSC